MPVSRMNVRLARGVIEGLNKGNIPVAVFLSTREVIYEGHSEKLEVTPIAKSYEEPIGKCRVLVIVKSIISSSCVVKNSSDETSVSVVSSSSVKIITVFLGCSRK